ncbi:MAG: orotidine-5'-phosphate decarboxylase [Syntrophales bacterium LBB04]|nr:orotidine-5'-phosphate decarboxylase [Syntrophales bacterium LBB04]
MKSILINDAKERLIFALDWTGDFTETLAWVKLLKGHVGMFKVGMEAFTRYGPEIVTMVQGVGDKVFLDLKFHDIPQTVARASEAAVGLGVAMFNVHALGGRKMLREAVLSAGRRAQELHIPKPIILAVTVLTSLNDNDLEVLGFRSSLKEIVVNLARLAQDEGASGVVASPQDIAAVKKACGQDFIIVSPGIRDKDIAGDDQKRTLTAGEALRLGADYLVVGRPIRMAADPVAAADSIVKEMSIS